MNKLVIAYIGLGKSISQYHLPYTRNRDDIEIRYIYRRKEDREADMEIEQKFSELRIVENIEVILDDQEINLVVIGSPNQTHVTYAKQCLDKGKNLLIEKPIALSKREAEEIFDLAKRKNLIVMPNQNRRYDGDFLTLKEVLNRNVLGEILEIESHYDYYKPNSEKTSSFMYLFGLGVHTIDQMIYLNGKPSKVIYDVRSYHNPGNCDDYFDIDLFYGKKKVTVKTSYYSKISLPRFVVHGTLGSLMLPQTGHNSVGNLKQDAYGELSFIDSDGLEHNEMIKIKISEYGSIIDNMKDVILNDKRKLIKDEEVLLVLDILESGISYAKMQTDSN